MRLLWLDYETWSFVNITRGTDVYMNHARPLLMTYAFDDEPVLSHDFTLYDPDDYPDPLLTLPQRVQDALRDPNVLLIAHNAFFDRMVTTRLLNFTTGYHRWRCTYAMGLAHGLPGGLGPLGFVLGVEEDHAKIADGFRLIKKFCCGPKPFEKDEEWEKFVEYAVNDVEAMRDCAKRMPNWNYKGDELELYHVDQVINNRGFAIDLKLAENAMEALAFEKERLADQTMELTDGEIESATKRAKLLLYLCEVKGCFLPDLKATTILNALEDEALDEDVKLLLRIRLQSAKASPAKFKRLRDSAGPDNRLRGTTQYCGANRTGRWAGRTFQPQNLPRATMNQGCIRNSIDLILNKEYDTIPLFATINEACSNALRGLIVAEEGKKLVVADYGQIESRVNAWLAGETWKLQAFREKKDIYCSIYEQSFGMPGGSITKKDPRRQHGKVLELFGGYGGGVGAFINFAGVYNVDLEELGRVVPETAPADVMAGAEKNWNRALEDDMTYGLSHEAYVACDALKIMYRRANAETASSWHMYEDAARKAVYSDGEPIAVGRIVFDCPNPKWLRIKLPSGRYLCYANPKVNAKGELSYMGWRNKKWTRTKTYGGKLCENIVQAVSRDILGYALLKCEAEGYPVVLHIHDEIICEVAMEKTLARLIDIMATNPAWARGLPLHAEGFEGTRYEKH